MPALFFLGFLDESNDTRGRNLPWISKIIVVKRGFIKDFLDVRPPIVMPQLAKDLKQKQMVFLSSTNIGCNAILIDICLLQLSSAIF